MSVEAVVFDWGGTLSHFAVVEMEDMWRLAARHLDPGREEALVTQMIAVEQASWERVAGDQQPATLAQILATASAELGLDVAEAVLQEAAVHHLDTWTPHIRHDPDAKPVLEALRQRGLRLGLLSNTHWPRTFHDQFLERDGLLSLIQVRAYTSEMAHTKPHPDSFHAVLDALDVRPAEAVFVGDRGYDDIFGAQRVGMRAVLRANANVPHHDVAPDATIAELPELLAIIDAWR